LRSRWTIPRSCAYSSPAAIWRAMSTASDKGTVPFFQPLRQILAGNQLHREETDALP
jgi:hypothetical protein